MRSARNTADLASFWRGIGVHHCEVRETGCRQRSALFLSCTEASEVIVLQSQHHSLKPAWSSTQRFLENGLQRPFLLTGQNCQAHFLDLSIILFRSAEGVT